jgi:hypothetical protein
VPAVTGTGALTAQAAALAGAGVSSSTGTGALSSQAAQITGAGTSASTGTGALAAQAATIAGAGTAGDAGVGCTPAFQGDAFQNDAFQVCPEVAPSIVSSIHPGDPNPNILELIALRRQILARIKRERERAAKIKSKPARRKVQAALDTTAEAVEFSEDIKLDSLRLRTIDIAAAISAGNTRRMISEAEMAAGYAKQLIELEDEEEAMWLLLSH